MSEKSIVFYAPLPLRLYFPTFFSIFGEKEFFFACPEYFEQKNKSAKTQLEGSIMWKWPAAAASRKKNTFFLYFERDE